MLSHWRCWGDLTDEPWQSETMKFEYLLEAGRLCSGEESYEASLLQAALDELP
jgi:hypothetical protein